MTLIKIGTQFINLDRVTNVEYLPANEHGPAKLWAYFDSFDDSTREMRTVEFEGDEANILQDYLTSIAVDVLNKQNHIHDTRMEAVEAALVRWRAWLTTDNNTFDELNDAFADLDIAMRVAQFAAEAPHGAP